MQTAVFLYKSGLKGDAFHGHVFLVNIYSNPLSNPNLSCSDLTGSAVF